MTNPNNLDLTEDRIFTIGAGLVYRVICAPSTWDKERIEADVNANDPTGISSPWAISEPTPRNDDFNNCNCLDCPDDPNRKHWLMNC